MVKRIKRQKSRHLASRGREICRRNTQNRPQIKRSSASGTVGGAVLSERIGVITRFLKRKVAIRRDGENFAIAFLPENTVVSRMQKQER